jgi:hypothetical protein
MRRGSWKTFYKQCKVDTKYELKAEMSSPSTFHIRLKCAA